MVRGGLVGFKLARRGLFFRSVVSVFLEQDFETFSLKLRVGFHSYNEASDISDARSSEHYHENNKW